MASRAALSIDFIVLYCTSEGSNRTCTNVIISCYYSLYHSALLLRSKDVHTLLNISSNSCSSTAGSERFFLVESDAARLAAAEATEGGGGSTSLPPKSPKAPAASANLPAAVASRRLPAADARRPVAASAAAAAPVASAAAADEGSTSDSDIPPRKASRGRIKQTAHWLPAGKRKLPSPSSGNVLGTGRVQKPTDRYRPPSPLQERASASPRVVVKKRRKIAAQAEEEATVVEAFAIPISEKSHRVMPAQNDLDKHFGRHYMARNPKKNQPFVNMTLSSTWHGVRRHIKPF